MRHDLMVIGSGAAAFAAAISAVRKGKRVIMVESGEPAGGTCVNAGCIPSKALLAAAGARHTALTNGFPGIETFAGPVDPQRLIAGKDAIVSGLRREKYLELARTYGWELRTGTGPARFAAGSVADPVVEAGGQRFEAEHYLIATGSTPAVPPIDGLAETGYLTSTHAMEPATLPASLLVLGGGYIGLEQAQLFARLGVDVTVLEARDRLAPAEEPELGAVISGVFADEGIGVHTNAVVTNARRRSDGVALTALVGGRTRVLHAERLLVATGRRPSTGELALDNAGVDVGTNGEVVVDAWLRTANPRIWAAGDVTGHPQFVYVAGAHGAVVADNIFDGARRTVDYTSLPPYPASATTGSFANPH